MAVLGTLLFIILVAIVLAALLGAGSYSVRRYWSPAGTEVVETSGDSAGAGAGIAAALIALVVLVLLFFGFTRWDWFGNPPSGQSNSPVVTTPASSPSSGSGGASPSSSPAASPS